MNHPAQWTIGGVTVTAVVERRNDVAVRGLLPTVSDEALAEHHANLQPWAVDGDGRLVLAIQALCLEADGQKIVVDTCIGPAQLPDHFAALSNDGSFLDALAAAGFGRDDVDVVVCTHLHFDHVGWNTVYDDGRWVPTFRRARYLVGRQEYEHWSTTPEKERARTATLRFDDAVTPLRAAGVLELVDSDHRISDAIRLVATPGHTPGHFSVAIASDGAAGLITGDCVHHPVQFAEPDWYAAADSDPAASSATRRRLIAEYADTPVLILGTHFPPPTAGHLVTTGDGVRFRPLRTDPEPPPPRVDK